jgi:hypothetical protein
MVLRRLFDLSHEIHRVFTFLKRRRRGVFGSNFRGNSGVRRLHCLTRVRVHDFQLISEKLVVPLVLDKKLTRANEVMDEGPSKFGQGGG